MLCAGLAYLPVLAIVDYELTLTAPLRLTADTGIDALTHAIEAYVSRLANPFSDDMAIAAMRSIWPNLRRVCAEPDDRAARDAMMGTCDLCLRRDSLMWAMQAAKLSADEQRAGAGAAPRKPQWPGSPVRPGPHSRARYRMGPTGRRLADVIENTILRFGHPRHPILRQTLMEGRERKR